MRRIFAAKGRPADNPLIVHVAAPEQARALARAVPPAAETLMSLWPGPLTLVLPRAAVVPDVTTAGQDTVAVRIPKHPAALALLRACGRPVAAPSANRSGRPSPTTAEHVHADLDGVVDVILDGGPCAVGLESTVVDVTRATPMVLRAGGPVARGAAVSRGRGRCALGTGP
ncbi:L-threonylcarbamoyladenylate synthase [Nannocystis radixulma]|uniref:L-threonylcarbamoyladenylate synthase n=1 Tax=Nannocystis radixulma TaxID=2995305 RepID=UPI00358DCF9C